MDLFKLHTAVDEMALSIGQSWDATKYLTCAEADSIFTVMALCGYVEQAATALWGHIENEEEGDRHFHIQQAGQEFEGNEIAEQMCATYVKELIA